MSLPTPYYDKGGITLYCGDCREILPELEPASVDLVLTDPPYSSGGLMRSDRNMPTSKKYQMSGTANMRPNFSGDSRDQRSYLLWTELWLRECLACAAPSAAAVVFTDWRQLPTLVDAIQVAGWVYRGIAAWDKTERARPQKGWFRAQMEFMCLGTNGPSGIDGSGAASVGVFRHPTVRDRLHATEKPVAMLGDILRTQDRWTRVLDPFSGAGSSLVAAKELGRRAIGIEISEEYCEMTVRRLRQEVLF